MSSGPIEIPNKSSFKINEVCALTGVKSYVLRFWESEFPEIAPMMSSSGVKLYEHRDIEAILLIKKLLFEEKFSIEKAKAELKLSMPKEHLVEDAFNDLNDEDFFSKNFDGKSDFYSESNKLNLRESNVKRVLVESEFNKLLLAKNKLTEMLHRAQSIEKSRNW